MIRESVLFENLKEEIYRMIVESNGISDEVRAFIYDNKEVLLDTVRKSIGTGKNDANGIEKSFTTITLPTFVKTFLNKEGQTKEKKHSVYFKFISFNFKDRSQFIKYKSNYPLNNGLTNSDGVNYDWVTIYTYTINGKVNQPDFFDTVGHELSHVYKQDMAGKPIPKNFKNYLKGYSDLESENEVERSIARIFYYSEKFEQEGYANGLYFYLKEKGITILTWDDIKKTDVWKHYQYLYDAINIVKDNKEETQRILDINYDNKKVETLLRVGLSGMKDFKERLLKVIFQIHQDGLNEGIRCTSIHYYQHFICD